MSVTEVDRAGHPFWKWVGGKRQLLSRLVPMVPARFGRYHEPFIGGGALYFALGPRHATIADSNTRLVRTYRGVQGHVDEVILRLSGLSNDRETFERVRASDVDAMSDAGVAAWLVYLNKTGFNGLYRVNSRNIYNVPFGAMTKPNICDERRLRACAAQLATTEILDAGFETVLDRASKGDFVYFDPPYVPLSTSSMFVSYTKDGFGMDDQRRLVEVAATLKRRGVHVLLSNSAAPAVYELYRGFEIEEVELQRLVGAKSSSRGAIKELLIR
ncbi:MAG: Dam family site-specific DNA-(adenine-N6)-methyltransferase [Polyangiaceae bacterium]|nr:Dam family site-specific DNA-(adenine-N6)-methyltransferase [Polyangiaceae bacterium]